MTKKWYGRLFKFLLSTITIAVVVLYAIGILLPWMSADVFWFGGVVGLAFPYLAFVLIFFIIIWLFIRKKNALLLFILFCLGFKQIKTVIAINLKTDFDLKKAKNNIRVISWNIAYLSGNTLYSSKKSHSESEVVASLISQDADIICLQEFQECNKGCKGLELLRTKYLNFYLSKWHNKITEEGSTCAIFSKFPIINKDLNRFKNGEYVIRTDIKINNDTISVFTTHLESFMFTKDEFKKIDLANANQNLNKKNTRGILSKLKHKLKTHSNEADIVSSFFETTHYPIILAGDLNEVSTNNTYWKIRGDKQDAFLKKGLGFGTTYNSLKNNLRIDFIFPDSNFRVNQFKLVDENLSDHKMLVTDLLLKR